MARSWSSRWKYGVLAGAFSLQTGCHSLNVQMNSCEDGDCAAPLAHREPKVNGDPSMMSLATDLDHLEKHIDWYGSVTVKSPDIWGQQRLTRYREEFEKEMVKELGEFELTLQGAQSRSDQAMVSLGIAVQPPPSPKSPPSLPNYATPPLTPTSKSVESYTFDQKGNMTSKTTDVQGQAATIPPPPPPPKIEVPTAVDASTLVDKDPKFDRSPAKVEKIGFNTDLKKNAIGLEPTEYLNQKQRYLNHLAQIRRNNEGDDTADSPGYSLNLIRLPVSVLPGKRTDRAHGAEVTMTIEPVLTSELLPSVFRNFVMNDLVKELGFPLTKYLDGNTDKVLSEDNRLVVRNLRLLEDISNLLNENKKADDLIKKLPTTLQAKLEVTPEEQGKAIQTALLKLPINDAELRKEINKASYFTIYAMDEKEGLGKKIQTSLKKSNQNKDDNPMNLVPVPPGPKPADDSSNILNKIKQNAKVNEQKLKYQQLISLVTKLTSALKSVNFPYSTGTRNKKAIPFSQFYEVHGAAFPFEIALQANRALGQTIKEQGYAHLPDVQAFLAQELDAAYRFLKEPANADLWNDFCTSSTVNAVRSRQVTVLEDIRTNFRQRVMQKAGIDSKEDHPDRQAQYTCTAACAWAILVQSALLNDRLMLDMKETAASQHCEPFCTQEWVDYYLPCPSGTARNSFNAYVKKRWPIKVFALDPINDEQNLADTLSTRRETQLALAIAFKSGNINGSTFSKFARRLEAEYETIDLNRTQVGFGHGNDTFGWRFYPRFQSPPTRSNAAVLLRDQIIGGPNKSQLLRERRLEPGMRECTALVIMPSFVPSVTIETTTNWFGLANPKHKVFDHTQHLNLSRTIKAAQTQGACLTDANCYRDGDDRRLKNRVEQLANRLPMQTLSAQVPVESNVGGHELFIHGTTDLAPELYGWYGAPGVDQSKVGTSLFLVGNHFSVTQTQVLVGNVAVPKEQCWMISRQVMRVQLPINAMTFKQTDGTTALNVHVATPYGVSREITIPDVSKKPDPAKGLPLNTEAVVKYAKQPTAKKDGLFELASPVVGDAIFVKWSGDTAPDQVTVRFTFMFRDCPLVIDIQTQGAEMKPIKTPIKNVGGVYRIEKSMLDEVLKELFCRVNQFGGLTNETSPLKEGNWSANVTLINKDDPSSKDSTNTLNLKFKCSIP